MLRRLVLAIAAFLWIGSLAFAQSLMGPMVPVGVPSSLSNLTYLAAPQGVLQQNYDTYAPVIGYFAHGSVTSPITTEGGTFSITRYQNFGAGACNSSPNDTECDAALNVIVRAGTTDTMVLSGINVTAIGSSTNANANIQAFNCHGIAQGSAVGIAGCGYMEGRRVTSTAKAQGIEITSYNQVAASATVRYNTTGDADGIWLTARSDSLSFPVTSALHIGIGNANGQWQEGITINQFAATAFAINDQSNATTSINIAGSHGTGLGAGSGTFTDVINTVGATVSGSIVKGTSLALSGAGQIIAGANSAHSFPTIGNAWYQSYSTDTSPQYLAMQNTNDARSAFFEFYKSRGTTVASAGAVHTGDGLGQIAAFGNDGTNPILSSIIWFTAAGTIGTSQVPGNILFYTANAAGTLTQAMTIDQAQTVAIPGTTTGTPVASLCLDSSNKIIKKTTTGACI